MGGITRNYLITQPRCKLFPRRVNAIQLLCCEANCFGRHFFSAIKQQGNNRQLTRAYAIFCETLRNNIHYIIRRLFSFSYSVGQPNCFAKKLNAHKCIHWFAINKSHIYALYSVNSVIKKNYSTIINYFIMNYVKCSFQQMRDMGY